MLSRYWAACNVARGVRSVLIAGSRTNNICCVATARKYSTNSSDDTGDKDKKPPEVDSVKEAEVVSVDVASQHTAAADAAATTSSTNTNTTTNGKMLAPSGKEYPLLLRVLPLLKKPLFPGLLNLGASGELSKEKHLGLFVLKPGFKLRYEEKDKNGKKTSSHHAPMVEPTDESTTTGTGSSATGIAGMDETNDKSIPQQQHDQPAAQFDEAEGEEDDDVAVDEDADAENDDVEQQQATTAVEDAAAEPKKEPTTTTSPTPSPSDTPPQAETTSTTTATTTDGTEKQQQQDSQKQTSDVAAESSADGKTQPPPPPAATPAAAPVAGSATALVPKKTYLHLTTEHIHPIGVIASQVLSGTKLVLHGEQRIEITGLAKATPTDPYLTITYRLLETPEYDKDDIDIMAQSQQIFKKLQFLLLNFPDSVFAQTINQIKWYPMYENAGTFADMVAAALDQDAQVLQRVLTTLPVRQRQALVLELLQTEIQANTLRLKIAKQMEDKADKFRRQQFATEQIKAIRKELGMEKDEKAALKQKYEDALKQWTAVPTDVRKVIDEELSRLEALEAASSEYNVTRNYLDWLTSLPWGTTVPDNLDTNNAQKVLDADHYGLEDIKDRILEFIAIGRLKGSVKGKIILLVGPPGTGKTSIAHSIAKALQRPFYSFSVGGMSDVSELKGHRRTYVGAMPGKLLQALKILKAANPVILIDEIDKLGRGHHGDPAAALLEVLDPEQNSAFLDHYLDVPVDLSSVLFICTANVLDTIPKPLLDRMELMTLTGYIPDEQAQIATRHLIPTHTQKAGLTPEKAEITQAAVQALVHEYCREAGVRKMQKSVERIFRKVAYKLVTHAELQKVTVDAGDLAEYLGKPPFRSDRYYEQPLAGVVMGLAWTAMGGATLYVETARERGPGRGRLLTTGQMGDVMKESTAIAHTYAKEFLQVVDKGNRFFDTTSVHMHLPQGATPKDGPSAGSTMVTAFISLALNLPPKPDLAMTGEVTLTGKILAIGGVTEKTIAAKRSGVKTIIFPRENKKDFDEVPKKVREGLEVHYADTYLDIARISFPSLAPKLVKAKPTPKPIATHKAVLRH